MDSAAFDSLYDRHAVGLLRFLLYRTGDRALAEDLAADAFERVLRSRRSVDPRKGSERAWLYAIALDVLRDHARRRGTEQRAPGRLWADGDVPPPDPEIGLRDHVSRALGMLGAAEREAIALRYGADLPVAEIARITGDTVAAVEKRLQRALQKLREILPSSSLVS